MYVHFDRLRMSLYLSPAADDAIAGHNVVGIEIGQRRAGRRFDDAPAVLVRDEALVVVGQQIGGRRTVDTASGGRHEPVRAIHNGLRRQKWSRCLHAFA